MVEIINECLSGLNHLGDTFCRYAVGAFLQSALLVIVLFGIDLLLRKRLRAVVRYCIWLLVLVKLILPPTLSLPTGIGYWAPSRVPVVAPVSERPAPAIEFEPVTRERETPPRPQPADVLTPLERVAVSPVESDSAVAPVPASLTPITWQAIVLLFWLVGMLAFVVLLAQRVRFVRGLVAASSEAEGPLLVLLEECRRQMRLRGRVELRTSDALPSPAVCGLWRPTILMPASLVAKLSPDELKATLIHELAHIKRADLWVNAVQTVLQVVYFYNPFVWLANASIRRTCEEAVDETVLVALGGRARDYSNTLISISETVFWKADFGLRLIGVAESKRALKRRIRHMVTRPVPHSAKIGALGTLAILLIAAVLLPMARGERSSRETSTPSAAAMTEASETDSSAQAGDVIVDPNTGVKFVLAKTFSGADNGIKTTSGLMLSPDARFLIYWGRVIPLDGTEGFSYTEYWDDVREVAVSPNGRYIAHGWNTVWLQPVSPETLRPNGPAKKLLDLVGDGHGTHANWSKPLRLHWTQDSQVLFFRTYAGGQWRQHAFSAATGDAAPYPDAASTGLPSPDGKCIALTDADGFWVKPMGNGAARVLWEEGEEGPAPAPECWSRDGKWLIGFQRKGARFVSYPEGQVYHISLPKDNANCVGTSPDRETLYFYQAGYKSTHGIWVAPADGTGLSDMNIEWSYGYGDYQWAPDGKAVFLKRYTYTRTTGWKTDLFLSDLSGEKPTQFTLNPTPSTDGVSVSPDGKWSLFLSAGESGSRTVGLKLMPLSMADHGVGGPATVVFRTTFLAAGTRDAFVWSPDSTRVALTCKAEPVDDEDIWVVFTDGRTPVRLTRTAVIEHHLTWSPDGKMLAYICDDAGAAELKVIPTAGGEAVVLRQWVDADAPLWGWSPDSKSLTVAEEDMLVRQPLSGGKAEPIVNLKEYGIEGLMWLGWSPDGRRLALAHWPRDNKYGQLLFARLEGGLLQQTGATEGAVKTRRIKTYAWSPESTRVACEYEGIVATGPEGRLYAVAVDDIVERIEAGAIPPTGPKPAEPASAGKSAQSKPTPQFEPITGPVFSDNFDEGLSEYWQIVPANATHAVENGQLMLSNCSACLNQIDWADYLVTVRVCVKEGASGRGIAYITTRLTSSDFGTSKMDRYSFVLICSNNASASSLWLGLYYHNSSGAIRGATLGSNPCPLVPGKWYKLAFEVRGEQLRAYLDDELVMETTDARLSRGPVWISASGAPVLFDDFSVRRLP